MEAEANIMGRPAAAQFTHEPGDAIGKSQSSARINRLDDAGTLVQSSRMANN